MNKISWLRSASRRVASHRVAPRGTAAHRNATIKFLVPDSRLAAAKDRFAPRVASQRGASRRYAPQRNEQISPPRSALQCFSWHRFAAPGIAVRHKSPRVDAALFHATQG